ncbi:ribonucleotide reductase [Chytriomyces cf. hyalinus JEL632]|nr:ribonucleotide reductase [Chytriomyces cf. hyalinus JEL632]
MYVVKRSLAHERVNVEKIQHRIEKLCIGLPNVDPAKIAIKVLAGLYSGVTTVQLDQLAAEDAIALQSIHPDYAKLASRLVVSNLHKQTSDRFSVVINRLYTHIHPQTKEPMPLISDRVYSDVMVNAEALDNAIEYTRDYAFSYFGIKTLEKAYLLKVQAGDGAETVERPQHLWMRVAVALHGRNLEKVLETYHGLSNRQFIHATPTLFNAGTLREGLSSCFLLTATKTQDSIEGIYDLLKETAVISKHSGRIGISMHDIRAKGSLINSTNGQSEGIVPMLRMYNASVKFVAQANKRPGSAAVYLEPWHPEILQFLQLKEPAGIEELRARDLFYALWIPDLFMKKVLAGEDWMLMCPKEAPGLSEVHGPEFEALYHRHESEGRYRSKIPARDLMFSIIQSQIKTGGPFMLYKDHVNAKNNQAHLSTIRNSNLCTEIMQYTSDTETAVCNLASIGLPSFVRAGTTEFDYRRLYQTVKIVTKNLDRVIGITHYPVAKAKYSNMRHRPLGLGVSGLADVFVMMKVPFESAEARVINRNIFETIYFGALEASCEFAQEFGAYDSYAGSGFSKGQFQFDLWDNVHATATVHSGMWNWDGLKDRILKYGVHNSLLTTCMPTASTAQIIGYTEATEPINSNVYKRQTLSGEFQIINHHLVHSLLELGLWNEGMKQRIIEDRGSVQNIAEIPAEVKALFKTSWEISQKVVIDHAAHRAVYIDQSQSMNLFLADPTYKKIMSMHFYAFDRGLKTGMYYLKMKPPSAPLQVTLDNFSLASSGNTADGGTTLSDDCELVGLEICRRCS